MPSGTRRHSRATGRDSASQRPGTHGLAAALCLLTAACGSSSDDKAGDATTEAAASKNGYPVSLDNCGQKQTFEKAPSRVVAMNGASVAEVSTLLALDLDDKIVANQQTYGNSEVPGRAEAIHSVTVSIGLPFIPELRLLRTNSGDRLTSSLVEVKNQWCRVEAHLWSGP
ncbi:hypothetical protein [Streptomyces tendae]